jgi:hypothetical protein
MGNHPLPPAIGVSMIDYDLDLQVTTALFPDQLNDSFMGSELAEFVQLEDEHGHDMLLPDEVDMMGVEDVWQADQLQDTADFMACHPR